VSRLSPELVQIITQDLADAPDPAARAGLCLARPDESGVYIRHAPIPEWLGNGLFATVERDRCSCTAHGQRCALLVQASSRWLRCPACLEACAPPAGAAPEVSR
jgi:hypothetical protein